MNLESIFHLGKMIMAKIAFLIVEQPFCNNIDNKIKEAKTCNTFKHKIKDKYFKDIKQKEGDI